VPPTQDLIACPHCDTLHTNAIVTVLALAITSLLLMIAAVSFPFLDLTAAGQTNSTSVIGAVLAFSDTFTLPLAVAVGGFIILLPLLRLAAIIYAVDL